MTTLEKGKLYYTPPSKDLMEAWNYTLDVNDAGVKWILYIVDTRDGPEYLRISQESLPIAMAAEGVQKSEPEDRRKLVNYIFTLPIDVEDEEE